MVPETLPEETFKSTLEVIETLAPEMFPDVTAILPLVAFKVTMPLVELAVTLLFNTKLEEVFKVTLPKEAFTPLMPLTLPTVRLPLVVLTEMLPLAFVAANVMLPALVKTCEPLEVVFIDT